MKNKEKVFEPSEQDIQDAWLTYQLINNFKETGKLFYEEDNLYNEIETGIRLILSEPEAKYSPGFDILDRLYRSWIEKTLMASDIKNKLENKEIDQIIAYALAVTQTIVVSMPFEEKEKKEFQEKRRKYVKSLTKRWDEWKKIRQKQEDK